MKTPPYARPVMPMLLALAFAGLGALHAQNPPATPPDDGFRRWTDTSGKAVEAQLVELLPDRHTVRLRLRNGKDLTVKLERLSAADRKWVAEWKPRGGPQAAAVVAEWTVLDEDRSSQDHNAANDLVSIALRQPPGQPEALEILVTFRKGTPDSGAISICLMSLESPSEGVSFQVTLKQPEPQVSVEKLIDGKWKATSDFRTRAERTQDQIRIHVHGWILKAFHYSASLSVRAQQFVEIPMPSDNSGRVIKVDGEVGDWVGAKAAWQSATARLHATHCVADPRVIWANLNGDLLQLRIQFPDRAVLWEKDGDVKCHSGVGIAFNPKGTERMQPKLWCRFPREVKEVSSELGAANQQLTFSLGASEMEIAVKGLPKHDDGMRIGLLFDSLKSDDIAGGVFCAGKTAAENAEETRKLGRRDMWDGGVTLLQHKLLACEMDRATADALEKRLAGDAAAANLAYRKIPALVKQGKIREIARSELGGHSGQRAKAEPQGKKVKLIRSSTGEEYEWPLGLHVELEATADSDPKFEWLNTFIELNEEWQQPGKLFFRRIDCGFAPFPAARPVVFWRWDEGEKSALLIGSYEPVPRPPALVAGPAVSIMRFALYKCPEGLVPDIVANAEVMPAKAAAILSAKATLTTGGFFPCGAFSQKGQIKSGVDAPYSPPGMPQHAGTLGTTIQWEVNWKDASRKVWLIAVGFWHCNHPNPLFANNGVLTNPEFLNQSGMLAYGLTFANGEVKILRCEEHQGLGLANPVTTVDSNYFLVLQRESP